jgi:hypothetical protein
MTTHRTSSGLVSHPDNTPCGYCEAEIEREAERDFDALQRGLAWAFGLMAATLFSAACLVSLLFLGGL